jgi:hypothetical protein
VPGVTSLHWLTLLAFAGVAAALLALTDLVMGQIDQDLRDFADFSGMSFDIGSPVPFDSPFRSPSTYQGRP